MNSDIVTTPFGRRGVSFGLLARQFASKTIDPARSIDKWKLFRTVCEARPSLGISDRSLAVLNALISFYPKSELSEENGLVVFPSNQQLSLRAHGMAEQTLRRHLCALVDAGLIIRKDSPNGKRYARKDRAGGISDAYGFSLAPLIARTEELQEMAAVIVEERLRLQRLREKITICRRDIFKFIELLQSEHGEQSCQTHESRYRTVISHLDRKTKAPHLALILEELDEIRSALANQLQNHAEIQKLSANAYQNERLIQNSESESILEAAHVAETTFTSASAEDDHAQEGVNDRLKQKISPQTPVTPISEEGYDLQTVLQACPEIEAYGPKCAIRSWQDMKVAVNVVKTMLSISQSAYDEAEKVMGTKGTLTTIACILERSIDIKSAGGYLRSLTQRQKTNEFSMRPMLMALLRSKMAARHLPGVS
ncbi:replication initiation protein RepC [Agrobacterium larrymoorei]|uniref:plasmid replication protein RepC n=1 Tax=Agrobacterium larrymoorei TaxID=160699 RepID=UPI0015739D80|nr:plasmid replication protein RepC [Agrobacterium larrymoorei]NTJ43666.1 replication initiation protein RepC [Agrobacterium larrymoorei]